MRFPFTDAPQTDAVDRSHRWAAREVRHARPAAEDHLHEFIGRVLGHGPRRGARAHVDRRQERSHAARQRARVSLRRLAARPGGVPAAAGAGSGPNAAASAQQLPNPTPHTIGLRAIVLALDRWVRDGVEPPASKYPRAGGRHADAGRELEVAVVDGVHVAEGRFPSRRRASVDGPAGAWPFLVPQVDEDGNELAGIRLPDQAVPIGTLTGWNFRDRIRRQSESDRAAARQPDSVCEDRGRSRQRSAQVARGAVSRQVGLSRPRHRGRARRWSSKATCCAKICRSCSNAPRPDGTGSTSATGSNQRAQE